MTLKQKRTLSGVKGFALCFILGYMAFSQIFAGGHLGYQLLFSLFGFITFQEYINEKIYPGPFFVEKVKRLWPQLAAMVCVVTVLYSLFFFKDLPLIRGQALSALLFLNNIQQGTHAHPLSIHQPSPFGHLWFVSLLVQCYLVFTLAIAGKKTKQKIVSTTFLFTLISIISALLMGVYGGLGLSESRIFYMSDSRLFSFFLASPVAFYAAFSKGGARAESKEIAMLGIIILFVIFVLFMPESMLSYFGGLLLSTILLNSFLLFLSKGNNAFESVFHFPLFTFLGERAYPIYLYSMPVFFFIGRGAEALNIGLMPSRTVALIVLIVVAQASHFLFTIKKLPKPRVMLAAILVTLAILAGSFYAQEPMKMKENKKETSVVKTVETQEQKRTESTSITEKFQPSDELAAAIEQVNAQKPKYKLTNEDLGKLQSKKAFVLGDSAISDAREAYLKLMPEIRIHGDKNSTPLWCIEQLNSYQDDGPIVLQIGNDAALEYEQVKGVIDAAKGRTVYVINVAASSEFEDKNNDVFNRIASSYANVTLLDWYKEAKAQTDAYDEEGRMSQPATRLLAHLLAHSLLYDKPATAEADQTKKGDLSQHEEEIKTKEDDRASVIKEQ